MFSLDWPHRASPRTARSKSKTTTTTTTRTTTTSRKPLGSITNCQKRNNNCMGLHQAPPLNTIKVLSRLKFNKKGQRRKENECNIASISKFVKSHFSDKMNYMLEREREMELKKARENNPTIIESNALKRAQKVLHNSIFGQRHLSNINADSEQQQQQNCSNNKHQLFQLQKWGKHAPLLLELYEEEEDSKIKNENKRIGHPLYQCSEKYFLHKYEEAHVHAKEFLFICNDDEREMAFRQNVITLRTLGCGNAMELEEAHDLFNFDVTAPKVFQSEEGPRIRRGHKHSICTRCGVNRSSSYCDLNPPYLSKGGNKGRRGRTRRRKSGTLRKEMRSLLKRKEMRKEREEQVSIVRRAVLQSFEKLK